MAKAKLLKEKDMALTINDHERAGEIPAGGQPYFFFRRF
jgi:hypothetical protein